MASNERDAISWYQKKVTAVLLLLSLYFVNRTSAEKLPQIIGLLALSLVMSNILI